jgi:hypothetical protein
MIELKTAEPDDPQFIEIASQILNSAINCYEPNEVYVVHLDNWFNHKWNAFAAVIDLQLGIWKLDSLRKPPFNPNRIMSQSYFHVDDVSKAVYVEGEAPILHTRRSSYWNLHKRLKDLTHSGLFMWYSGNTKSNESGSLMVYYIGKGEPVHWYVSFYKKQEWQMNKIQDLSKKVLEEWLKQPKRLLTA